MINLIIPTHYLIRSIDRILLVKKLFFINNIFFCRPELGDQITRISNHQPTHLNRSNTNLIMIIYTKIIILIY